MTMPPLALPAAAAEAAAGIAQEIDLRTRLQAERLAVPEPLLQLAMFEHVLDALHRAAPGAAPDLAMYHNLAQYRPASCRALNLAAEIHAARARLCAAAPARRATV